MAHPNAEIVNSQLEGLESGDMARIRAGYSADVILHAESCGVLTGTFRGVDEVIAWIARVGDETNGTWRLETLSILGDDDHAVVISRVSGQRGDRTFDSRQVVINHVTDGKIDDVWVAAEDGASLDAFWS